MSPAERRAADKDRCAARGFPPGAVRRFRPISVRRHRLPPAVSRVRSVCFRSAPGFGSRAGLSGPLFRPFDRVQVSENHAFPELAFRRRFRGIRPFSPACRPSASPSPRFRSASTQFRTAIRRRRLSSRFTTRFRPPVPLVCCSFRSWFVSQVRFIVPFNSACFSSVRLALFASARFPSFQSRFVILFLSSFSRVVPAHRRFIYISRVYYTLLGVIFKCIFYQKTCSF